MEVGTAEVGKHYSSVTEYKRSMRVSIVRPPDKFDPFGERIKRVRNQQTPKAIEHPNPIFQEFQYQRVRYDDLLSEGPQPLGLVTLTAGSAIADECSVS